MGSCTCRPYVRFGVSVRFSFCMYRLLVTLPTSSMGMFDARIWLANCCQSMGVFRRFGESVSAARRAGDEDPDKAIIADTIKLHGNSCYGKMVTNVDRHRDVKYCTEIGTSALINNQRFRQLDVVTKDRAELTYFYGKRKVLADGRSAAPLEV